MAAVPKQEQAGAAPAGGRFLLEPVGSSRIPTPEGFSDDQRAYYRTAYQFSTEQILPKADAIEKKDNALLKQLLGQAGELGLLMIDIPEAYGGLGLDKTTSLLVTEASSLLGTWSVTIGGHVGIGTLPIVWFGNEAQKKKYLPKLATGELAASYALTEPVSGSDALGARTKAVLSPDGKHYLLNGSKLFITNAGFADVFVVFAKVDGEKFTGFIVERNTPGFTIGKEEHKMGIRGSSTCPLFFEDAKVPAENLLGEIGKGHKIAFNILNLGRLKLGGAVLGGMKIQLAGALKYAQERKQFKTAIVQFPLTREKLARMTVLAYAVESMAYRTTGLIDALLAPEDKTAADYDKKTIAAIEEFAIESSILKVFGSEALGQLVDDAVQIHGGVGFIEEYPVERAYRDQRVNRIFEGTNEINRMLISGMLLKRTLAGKLPLMEAAVQVEKELAKGKAPGAQGDDELAEAARATECIKRLGLYTLKAAAEKFGQEIEQHQEVIAAIADLIIDAYALDSMISRSRQATLSGKLDTTRVAMVTHYAVDALARGQDRARRALCATAQGKALEAHLKAIAPLTFFTPYDPVALREAIVKALEEKGGYPFPH